MIRKFVVTPGEFGPAYIEVDNDSYVVLVDEDDCPPESGLQQQQIARKNDEQEWDLFMENAADNTRVSIIDVKELWS